MPPEPAPSAPFRADLHVHASLSSAIGYDEALFDALLAQAHAVGLAALGLVAHLLMARLPALFAQIAARCTVSGDCLALDGLLLLPGLEVDTAEGPHLLALGRLDDVLALYERYADDVVARHAVPAEAFFARQAGIDLLNIAAHPLRPGHELTLLPADVASQCAALEVNPSDVLRLGSSLVAKTAALAAKYSLPLVGGSDAHHAAQVGSALTLFTQPSASLAALKAQIAGGAATVWLHPEAEAMVAAGQEAKRRILAERRAQPPA